MGVTLNINGNDRVVHSDPDTPLLHVLRGELKLKGAKFGCGLEQCGACAVLVDGVSSLSCAIPVGELAGRAIMTVEGIAESVHGAKIQKAFLEASAAHCGYCTPGLVVAATALLLTNPRPNRSTAMKALAPHICRCGCHPRVLRAIEIAAGEE